MDLLQGTITSTAMEELSKLEFPVYRGFFYGGKITQAYKLKAMNVVCSLRMDEYVTGVGISPDMNAPAVFRIVRDYIPITEKDFNLFHARITDVLITFGPF